MTPTTPTPMTVPSWGEILAKRPELRHPGGTSNLAQAACRAHAIECLGKKDIVAVFSGDWYVYNLSDLSNPVEHSGPYPDLDTAVRSAVVGVGK